MVEFCRRYRTQAGWAMAPFTREQLIAYLEDGLGEAESARVEQALRESAELRQFLRQIMQDCERGEHSLGGIWRRERLTCLTRDQLGSFLMEVLDDGLRDYVTFHLETIGCPTCLANLSDIKNQQTEASGKTRERRKRYFASSAGNLPKK